MSQPKKFISVKGKEIVDINNKPFLIKGTNLGNWLIPEGYMFKFKDISSPKLINEAFNELLGPEGTKAFWTKYLDNYITQADIHYLKSIGCNSIRVPFNYRLFTNETYLGTNKPDGYDAIVDYTGKNRESFEQIRKAAPADRAAIKKALYDMIENSKFAIAKPNKAYNDALGLK